MPSIGRKDFKIRMQREYPYKFIRFRQVESVLCLMQEQPDGKLAPLAVAADDEVLKMLGINEDTFWKAAGLGRKRSLPENPVYEAAIKYHNLRCLDVNGYALLCHYITKPTQIPGKSEDNHIYTPMYIVTDEQVRLEICQLNNNSGYEKNEDQKAPEFTAAAA